MKEYVWQLVAETQPNPIKLTLILKFLDPTHG